MDTETFISEIEKLYSYEYTSDYILDKIKQQRQTFLRLLRNFDGLSGNSKTKTIKHIKYLYDSVIDSISCFLEGDYSESRDIVYKTFFDYDNPDRIPLKVKTIDLNDSFFRIRENNTYNLYEKNEMFHIPFEKRELTSNQRFSMSGYPCLYLSSSIYGCWEELHRPNIDLCNIVCIKNVKPIKLINLSMPNPNLKKITPNYIYNIVLSLVCSLKVNKPYAPFKPEYIIPQNVLNSLIKRNAKRRGRIYYGIQYTSTIYGSKQCIFNDRALFENYVFPIQKNKKTGLCSGLCSLFEISNPTTMLINRLTKNNHKIMLHMQDDTVSLYETTEFGLLEKNLKFKKTFSL